MSTLPNTVLEYSRNAAQEYLQTVVFVDDRIYEPKSGAVAAPTKGVIPPKERKKVTKRGAAPESVQASVVQEEGESSGFSPHDIVTSFAKRQIVCSLYQPRRNASFAESSDIFLLCRAADIVIVDWDLGSGPGKNSLELICGLIKQAVEDVPEQLRLILVYTQEINLFAIAADIHKELSKALGDDFEPVEGGLAFHTPNSRVSVLGKTGRERPKDQAGHVVDEKELANESIKEFAKLASGLLHAATLLGLAKIRQNSRKILSKFNSSLDPAFFTHMAMSLPAEEATTHIIPLLISEIEAVLEDALPAPIMSQQLVSDWCRNTWVPGDHLQELLGNNGYDVRAVAESICLNGFDATWNTFPKVPKQNKKDRKAAKVLLSSANDISNHTFSHLMASRTFYSDFSKTLKLGAIVYKKSEDRYLLCVQPVCDSVRLACQRAFIFVELTKANSESGDQVSHTIVNNDGEATELYYQAKSFQCVVANFSPDSQFKQVITKTNMSGEEVFSDTSRKLYVWVDQLKPSHAQRAVERLASDLSRVGLTESEWLRVLERK